jgi:hypothetical protein
MTVTLDDCEAMSTPLAVGGADGPYPEELVPSARVAAAIASALSLSLAAVHVSVSAGAAAAAPPEPGLHRTSSGSLDAALTRPKPEGVLWEQGDPSFPQQLYVACFP